MERNHFALVYCFLKSSNAWYGLTSESTKKQAYIIFKIDRKNFRYF